MTREQLIAALRERGGKGLDGSPGDPLCAEAAAALAAQPEPGERETLMHEILGPIAAGLREIAGRVDPPDGHRLRRFADALVGPVPAAPDPRGEACPCCGSQTTQGEPHDHDCHIGFVPAPEPAPETGADELRGEDAVELRPVEGGYMVRIGHAALPEILSGAEIGARLRSPAPRDEGRALAQECYRFYCRYKTYDPKVDAHAALVDACLLLLRASSATEGPTCLHVTGPGEKPCPCPHCREYGGHPCPACGVPFTRDPENEGCDCSGFRFPLPPAPTQREAEAEGVAGVFVGPHDWGKPCNHAPPCGGRDYPADKYTGRGPDAVGGEDGG